MAINVVCIGGGGGQSEILRGLKQFDCNITAVVAVTDSGRSTGIIRKNFDIFAPGDLRNCIVALSESETLLRDLFQYRFEKGDYEGMSFGNLFLTALSKVKGDMFSAVKEAGKILKIKGKVLPSTLSNTHVCAELEDGSIVEEELNVRTPNKAPIKRLFMKDKEAKAPKEVISAIKKADVIVIGPGSLYTSILVHFLLPNLRKAVSESKAKKIFVCNMITQAGQTDNYDTVRHVEEIMKYSGDSIDYVLLNNNIPSKKIMKEYGKEGGYLIKTDINMIKKLGIEVIEKDILKKEMKEKEWNKVSSIRHDSLKTVKVILSLVKKKEKLKSVILAAGDGKRMRPFSFSESKIMIPFLGKPLLEYHVDECLRNGIEDIIIICNKSNIGQIKNHFKGRGIKFILQKEQKGPSNAILSAKKYLKDCDFLLKYGDSISSKDEVKSILEIYKNEKSDAVITLRLEEKNPHEYGMVRFEKGKAVEIIEKPKDTVPSNKAYVGLSILNSEFFFKGLEKDMFEKEVPPPQHVLSAGGKASYWVTDAKRLDLGRAWNILETNKLLVERFGADVESRNIAKNVKISSDSYVCPDAVIGENVIIEGYSSVNGVIGKGSVIKNSFIMEGSKIGKNCLIEASVIGRDNMIGDNFRTIVEGKEIKMYVKGRYVDPTIKKAGIFTGKGVMIMDNLKSLPGKMVFPKKIITKDIVSDKLIRAILFDADNTIYATKNVAKKADMEAMKFFSKQINRKAEELYNEWKEIVKLLINNKDPKKRTRKYSYNLLAKKNKFNGVTGGFDVFMKTLINNIEIMPGLKNILPSLSKYKLAIMSEDGSDLTLPKLKKFKIDGKFDTIITSDKIGEMKPSKEYYEKVFSKFNIEPNECLVIGDNYEKDLKIAKALGAATICFGQKDNRADYSINNYEDLPELLNKI